jgi:enamine deaminase RidA (YjgF/YER057c/UK114 family)
MKKEVMKIPGVPKPPSPFNHVVKAGNFLFLSSQLSVDLHTHTLLKGTTAEQTRQALKILNFSLSLAEPR